MQRPSLYPTPTAILFAVGCLLLSMAGVTGAHAQEQTQAQIQEPVQAPSPQPGVVADSSVARDRELIRAHRMERRRTISESTGISLGELDDLLRKIRPTAEERNSEERRTQTGQLSIEDPDENP